MSAASRPRYTLADYVRLEEFANLKHEFLDGQIFAMADGTLERAAMASAVNAALVSQLRGRPCQVYTSDARVRIAARSLDTYPDVSVVCGPTQRDADDANAMVNPVVLVEVTSDSTEGYDRGDKFEHYKHILSLREVVFVSHRCPSIEVHRRGDDGAWSKVVDARAGMSARLETIGCDLVVDEIFRTPMSL